MIRDELGEEVRAYGSDFLEAEYSFPAFDEEDEAMFSALNAWSDNLETRGQEEWEEHHGPENECRIFLEEKHSSQFARMQMPGLW